MDFEIRLLRYALALAQHRNFARAARSLKITQPGLSRSIQSLERAAGVQIFIRGAGAIEVTDAGEVFLEYAREVMSHSSDPVSYTHLRAHETDSYLVCRL